MEKDEEYKRICQKLGFIPSEYQVPDFKYEDDTWVNPFLILTPEENEFLYVNGYLRKKDTRQK